MVSDYDSSDYDLKEAFRRIEIELIDSMIRNMKRHRAEETEKGYEWSQWQAEQLKALEQYKRENQEIFEPRFKEINHKIHTAMLNAHAMGKMLQEEKILKAIEQGFELYKKQSDTLQGKFFTLNERKLNALVEATVNDMQKAEHAVLRMANDKYRKILFNAQVYANTGAGTYEKAVDMAVKDMLAAGLNCVEYRNGARHTLKSYADMAIRTASKRAYLQGEGEMRKKWGIHTVIMNKRGNPCPLCLPWVGKVLIDDVWSGGTAEEAKEKGYPLMSTAMSRGLYHPNCRDVHTTYFEGISTPPDSKWTKKELEEIEKEAKRDAKEKYAEREAEKYNRLAKISFDPENRKRYKTRASEWESRVDELQEYRPINRSNTVITKVRGKKDIHIREIENSTYDGGIHISNSVELKPKQMHNIETSLNNAIKIIGRDGNVPMCIIISSVEMQTNAICSYNAVDNILYIDSVIGDTHKLLELQKDLACPNNPLSTYVHELIHWKDAEEYRKTKAITNQSEYLKCLRVKCKKKLDKLTKQGYNIKKISNYATAKYHLGAYDETLTEYYVLKLLGKGD